MNIHREQLAFDRFKAKHGQIIGCLVERNPETNLFDAVTEKFVSVQTCKKLPVGTKVRLFKGSQIVEVQ